MLYKGKELNKICIIQIPCTKKRLLVERQREREREREREIESERERERECEREWERVRERERQRQRKIEREGERERKERKREEKAFDETRQNMFIFQIDWVKSFHTKPGEIIDIRLYIWYDTTNTY